jgi:hypothetical protein
MWTIMSVTCVFTPALSSVTHLSPGDDEDEYLDEETKEERALLAVDDGEGQGEGEDSGPEDISALVRVWGLAVCNLVYSAGWCALWSL